MQGFCDTLEKYAILLKVRSMEDEPDSPLQALWAKRKAMIKADPLSQKTMTNFPKYPDSSDPDVRDFCSRVNAQLSLYRGKKGVFARDWVMEAARTMPAYLWWDQNGSSVPELQAMARMVLAQPASASIIERINSEFEFVKDRRRNRLGHQKADQLVSLFHNLRLLKRMRQPKYEEPAIAWGEDLEQSHVTRFSAASTSSSPCALLKST